jgi:hypothetical protein
LGTLKLTDGQQINTGYGRESRALGYIMEIVPGRWVARVRDLGSDPLPLGAAKKAAIALYRTRTKGEPKDWVKGLNQQVANELERAAIRAERRKWPLDLMGGRRRKKPSMTIERWQRQAILDTERVLIDDEAPTVGQPLQGNDYQLDYYEDGFPVMPPCLRREPALKLVVNNKPGDTSKEEAA